jgi:glycosyltransferase involved in cell wall biosynthesis
VNRLLIDLRPIRRPLAGVARYCVHLTSELLKLRGELTIQAVYHGTPRTNPMLTLPSTPKVAAATCLPAKAVNTIWEFLPILGPLLVRDRVDVVHETYFARVEANRGAKRVCTIHDIIPIDKPEWVNPRNRYFSRRNFYRQCRDAHHIIAVSEYTKRKILEYSGMPSERISVIPCGVTPISASRDDGILQQHGLQRGEFVFFVGNLEPRKNIGLVAEALKSLGASYDRFQFVVAGFKNYESEAILAHAAGTLGHRFHYLGSITEAQKRSLLEAAALFVYPSLYEGFGIPIVECYDVGCPILIANNSSLSELIVDSRQAFDAQSVSSLKARLADALDKPAWLTSSVSGGRALLPNYQWHSVARRTADIYRDLLG